MTDGYDCYQNALAERVNGILKDEFLLQRPCQPYSGKPDGGPVGTHLQRRTAPSVLKIQDAR